MKYESELPVNDPSKTILNEKGKPVYTIETFEDIGKALGFSLLDYINDNPVSRLEKSTMLRNIDYLRVETSI